MSETSTKQKLGCLIVAIKLLVQLPLTMTLTFLILRHINATDVMWLLFWIGVPLGLILGILFETSQHLLRDEKK